MIKPKHIYVN